MSKTLHVLSTIFHTGLQSTMGQRQIKLESMVSFESGFRVLLKNAKESIDSQTF